MEKKGSNKLFTIFFIIGMMFYFKLKYDIHKMKNPSVIKNPIEIGKKYLFEEYGEEFEIIGGFPGRYGDFKGDIYLSKYKGTHREDDKYYHGEIRIGGETGVVREDYYLVMRREESNEEIRPILEELFGKNVLPVSGKGAIYIFGTINNEEDIKRYQKGIFDFVQYLKAINNFEMRKLTFIVIDERVLEDDFYNLGLKYKLIAAKNESKTEQEFLAKREKILSQIKITNTDKSERIDSINRGELRMSFEYQGYTDIIGSEIVSPKMMESGGSFYERIYKSEVGKTYDKVEDITMDRLEKYFFRRN